MADIRTRICWGKAVGVYIEKNRLTLTELGSTPAGITILKQDKISVDEDQIGKALKQLLENNLSQKELKNISRVRWTAIRDDSRQKLEA